MPPLPVLYDADCGFCRVTLALLLARDRGARLLPVAMQSPEGEDLLAGMPHEQRMRSAHVVTPDGRIHSGGDVVAPILAELGRSGGAAAARAAAPLLRPLYRGVAGNRTFFGRFLGDRSRDRATAAIARHRERALAAA